MQIALFDLDHTLIPFDSGNAFTRHLIERGRLDPGFEPQYLEYCRRYAEGTVDIIETLRFVLGALGVHPASTLRQWLDEFEPLIEPRVPDISRRLVREHQAAGRRCALVTATARFVAEPFARLLGVDALLATEPELDTDGRYTGEIVGVPCFREHKATHVDAWLRGLGLDWSQIERSWFYSDSAYDLPLLGRVSDPVAVNPDARLHAHALEHGWSIRRISRSETEDLSQAGTGP